MFKKVLVPLDGSEIAAKILPKVAEAGQDLQGQGNPLTRLLQRRWRLRRRGLPGNDQSRKRPRNRNSVQPSWPRPAKNSRTRDWTSNWVCEDGVPAREIVAYAQDNGYDLIALGTHGAGEVAWYMGGVADRVATYATVPVLLFRTLEFKLPLMKEVYSQVPGVQFPK